MKTLYLSILIILTLSIACTEQVSTKKTIGLEGLWLIKSVKVGTEEMTPNARWVRFNADSTQESGNGWLQHSIGTWQFKENTQELKIINTNGLDDSNAPFSINLSGQKMTWKRTEEGQAIEVQLERIEQLPAALSDQIKGLWQLKKMEGKGNYFTESTANNKSIFLRWDNRFVIRTEKGRMGGIYNIHTHKPELVLIPHNSTNPRSTWQIELNSDNDLLTLKMLDTDSLISRTFQRIHQFAE